MTWQPTGAATLFPVLEAELEMGALGGRRTQLALNASYRPPLSVVGRTVDRALLHRVAEATIKDFLDQMGRAIMGRVEQEPTAADPTSSGDQLVARTQDGATHHLVIRRR